MYLGITMSKCYIPNTQTKLLTHKLNVYYHKYYDYYYDVLAVI